MKKKIDRIVGFDSRRFIRLDFNALLGIGVTVDDYACLVRVYKNWIKNIFKSSGFKQNRLVYKSFDLNKYPHSKLWGIHSVP